MTEKQLIQYKVLCDEDEEIVRILFEIVETGKEIEGYHQIQEWVNNLYVENEQLKQQIKIFEKFLEGNDLSIDWYEFCGLDKCAFENPDFSCKDCIHLKGDVE
jgi:hypothetical protein